MVGFASVRPLRRDRRATPPRGASSGLGLNAEVPHQITAGPLQAELDGDTLRVGWTEPDWLGPGRLVVPGDPPNLWSVGHGFAIAADWVHATVSPLGADEPVLVVRLEARAARRGFATGEFAKPSVAWHFHPARRAEGGAPDGVRAFGHQYTEFALPVFSDAAMSRWRLLPIRPAVVLPLGLVAPDGRTLLLAPLTGFHEQVISVPAGKEQAADGLRAGWHGDIDEVDEGFATELAIIVGHGVRDCFTR